MIAGFPLRPIARTPNHMTHRVQNGGCRLPTGGWMQSWMRRWTRDQSGWMTLMRWRDLLRGPPPQVCPCRVNVYYEEESQRTLVQVALKPHLCAVSCHQGMLVLPRQSAPVPAQVRPLFLPASVGSTLTCHQLRSRRSFLVSRCATVRGRV